MATTRRTRTRDKPQDDIESAADNETEQSWVSRKIVNPVKKVFSQGLTPSALGLSLAFGITGGLFPIPGTTTLICLVWIYFFKLNPLACQLANLAMTPVELMMIVPFIRIGEAITFVTEPLPLSPSEVIDTLRQNLFGSVGILGASLLRAILAWLLFTVVATFVLYLILRLILTYTLPKAKKES
eukprot:TRINITY_DN8995_c0_g1_i1.p1 TRINITY_DN8995_c0_g1~~TRINITY_DN8995_c0_g1_i1.p1  ORF type:complete len:194 (-),score=15.72 TRINITY_DN8995_c0_g1_i1:26-577(-)